MPGSFPLGRICGIRVTAQPACVLSAATVAGLLALGWLPLLAPGFAGWSYWLLGAVGALLLFASILLHELAHCLTAERTGLPVHEISLRVCGGTSTLSGEPARARAELLIAGAGPLASLALGVLGWLAGSALRPSVPLLAGVLLCVAAGNLALAAFNLIPCWPLDGGRMLYAVLWWLTKSPHRALRGALGAGLGLPMVLLLAGLWAILTAGPLPGLCAVLAGGFLLAASASSAVEWVGAPAARQAPHAVSGLHEKHEEFSISIQSSP
jgi:Zn-dependent protease